MRTRRTHCVYHWAAEVPRTPVPAASQEPLRHNLTSPEGYGKNFVQTKTIPHNSFVLQRCQQYGRIGHHSGQTQGQTQNFLQFWLPQESTELCCNGPLAQVGRETNVPAHGRHLHSHTMRETNVPAWQEQNLCSVPLRCLSMHSRVKSHTPHK